jgi:hypothetical protein
VTENEFIQSAKADLATGHAGALPADFATDLSSILSYLARYDGDLDQARAAILSAENYAEAKSKVNALKTAKG